MAKEATQSSGKTTIILAVISAGQAIFLALVGTGQVPQFAGASAETVAEAVAADPPRLSVNGFDFKDTAHVEEAPCLQRSQASLVNMDFELTTSREEQVTTLTKGPVTVVVWCYESGLFFAVAGPSSSEPLQTANSIYDTLRVAFNNEVEPVAENEVEPVEE